MTTHHTRVPDLDDRLTEAATRAAELLRELRSELKEARRTLREVQAERVQAEAMVRRAVHDEVHDAVHTEVEQLGVATKQAIDASAQKAVDEFGRLTNLAMYGNEQGRGENVFDLMRARGDRYRDRDELGL